MAFLDEVGKRAQGLLKDVSKTVRHFTAFIFLVFTLGIFLGSRLAVHGPIDVTTALLVSLFLAVLSYFVTEIAIVFFVLFLLFALLL